MHVLDVVIRRGRNLPDAGNGPGNGVDAGDVVRDAVIDVEGVEDEGDAAGFADEALDPITDLIQMGVAGDAVGLGIGDGGAGFLEIVLGLDGAGTPK